MEIVADDCNLRLLSIRLAQIGWCRLRLFKRRARQRRLDALAECLTVDVLDLAGARVRLRLKRTVGLERHADAALERAERHVLVPDFFGTSHFTVVKAKRPQDAARHRTIANRRHVHAVGRRLESARHELRTRRIVDYVTNGLPRVRDDQPVLRRQFAHAFGVLDDVWIVELAHGRRRRQQHDLHAGGLAAFDHLFHVDAVLVECAVGAREPHVVHTGADGDEIGFPGEDILVEARVHVQRLVAGNASSEPFGNNAIRGQPLHDELHVSIGVVRAVMRD